MLEEWEGEFFPLLGHTARWEGFRYIVADQLRREKPIIVETGTLREPGNWRGDGQSTRMWSWIQERKGGLAVSVDMDMQACQLAQRECPNVHVTCMDSVSFLRGFFPFAPTLVYLDSLGCDNFCENDPVQWAMHQMAELASFWHRIPSGCLIASDDQTSEDQGKPAIVKKILGMMGIKPELDGYVIAWRKP